MLGESQEYSGVRASAEAARSASAITTKRLRILVAHNVSRARTGGMSRLMGFIHDEVVQSGHAVDYFCADDVPPATRGGWSRLAFPVLLRRHAAVAARAGKPYDVINVHEPSGAAVVAGRGALGNPVVTVTSYGLERAGWQRTVEEARLGRERIRFRTRVSCPLTSLWQSAFALRRADHVFCSNSESMDYLFGQLRRARDTVTRIHSGAAIAYAAAAADRDYCSASGLIFAGTWLRRKGVVDLVQAFASLRERHQGLTLHVLGSGVPDGEVIAAFPDALRPALVCTQAVNDSQSAAAFASASIYVLPSLFEGTPLTLIEAMMSGLPIVTTEVCGMRDVIHNESNGLLVPIRSPDAIVEAVERLIRDRELRERLGCKARAEALEKYTWDRVATPVLEVYERLCTAAA